MKVALYFKEENI